MMLVGVVGIHWLIAMVVAVGLMMMMMMMMIIMMIEIMSKRKG